MKFLLHALGTVMYAFSQWLVILVITRLSGVSEAGYYALYLGILTPLNIFLNYGLRNFIASDVQSIYSDISYQMLRFLGVLVFLIIGLIAAYFVENKSVFMIVLSIKFFDSLSELEYGNWNRKKLIKFYTYSQTLRLTLTAIIMFVMLNFDKGLVVSIAFPLSIALVYMFYDRYNSSFKSFSLGGINWKEIKNLLRLSTPLALSSLVVAANVGVTRIIIASKLGESTLAYYVYLQYYYTIAAIAALSVSQVLIPYLSESNNKSMFYKLLKNVTLIITLYGVMFSLIMIFAANQISTFIYNEKIYYELTERVLLAIGAIFSFVGVFYNAVLVSKKMLNQLFKLNLFLFLLTSLVTYYAVNTFGLKGAFLSFAIASVFSCAISGYFIFRYNSTK